MIYLDNSATTRQYDEVTAAMVRAMQEDYGNPSSLYQHGRRRGEGRQGGAPAGAGSGRMLSAGEWDVVFTSGGTEADNMAILVSMMHVNNEVGTVMPVGAVKEIMRSKGAPGLFHCDAVQSFGKMPLPSDADLISVSGHKIHGPKGSGALLNKLRKAVERRQHSGVHRRRRTGVRTPVRNGERAGHHRTGLRGKNRCGGRTGEKYGVHGGIAEMRQRLLDGFAVRSSDIEINSPLESGTAEAGQCCPSVLNVSFKGTRGEVILHTLEQERHLRIHRIRVLLQQERPEPRAGGHGTVEQGHRRRDPVQPGPAEHPG